MRDEMHAAYFHVRFRVEEAMHGWPGEFAIISGYATTGERWTDEENEASDRALEEQLRSRSVWMRRMTGYSPDTGHAEPGWAAQLSLADARAIGAEFRQDAIYWVRDGNLVVTHCDADAALVFVAPLAERVDQAT